MEKTVQGRIDMEYRRQAVAAMTPKERLLMMYDLAWKAANEGEMNRLRQLLFLMRKNVSLAPDPLVALRFIGIYRHCEQVLEERQDFAEVAGIMFHLKRAFSIAKEVSHTPEAEASRERINKAKADGALYFGKHGTHYSSIPRNEAAAGAQQQVTGKTS